MYVLVDLMTVSDSGLKPQTEVTMDDIEMLYKYI